MNVVLDHPFVALRLGTAIGCGLVAGVFFAFSTFVMPALARLPAPQGIPAMQSINVTAVTPAFMTALFGTAAASLLLTAHHVLSPVPGRGPVVAAGLLYLGGTVLVTIVFNVPLNDRLAKVDSQSAEGAAFWGRYLRVWTAWNHVRTAAALAASALLLVRLG